MRAMDLRERGGKGQTIDIQSGETPIRAAKYIPMELAEG